MQRSEHALGAAQPVHGGARDAAGVARALAAGVEAGHAGAAPIFPAHDAHGAARAGLGRCEHGVRVVKAAQLPAEGGQRLCEGVRDARRQHVVQVAPRHAGAVRRLHAARAGARAPGEKVARQLRGGVVIAAAARKGALLDAALPVHAAEGAFVREVLRPQRHEHGGVGIFPVAAGIAHAVGAHAALL